MIARVLLMVALVGALTACNTLGGLGRDLSEAGTAVEKSANWSQDQINAANSEMNRRK